MNNRKVTHLKTYKNSISYKENMNITDIANLRIINLIECPIEYVEDAIILIAGEWKLNPKKPLQFDVIKLILINSVLNN